MKTLIALLLMVAPAFAGQPTCDVQPTFEWADTNGSVVLMTWDDEFRVPKGDGYDQCWMSSDTTAECTSGATHEVSQTTAKNIVWDAVVLYQKPYSCE